MRALIVSADGFEDRELSEPLQQLQEKGVEVDIAAPQQGPITGKHGLKVSARLALSAVQAGDYDLLLLPGGEAPASLRKIPEAVVIARHFLQADKPVAAICHGPQLLIATGTHRHLLSCGETRIRGRGRELPGPRGPSPDIRRPSSWKTHRLPVQFAEQVSPILATLLLRPDSTKKL